MASMLNITPIAEDDQENMPPPQSLPRQFSTPNVPAKPRTKRQELKAQLVSKSAQDIHRVLTSSTENDVIIVELIKQMCEAVQSQVYFNFLAYMRTSARALQNIVSFLNSIDLKANKDLFKRTAGLERLLYHLSVKLSHDQNLDLLVFFETWYCLKFPCADATYPYIFLALFKQFEEKQLSKTVSRLYALRQYLSEIDFECEDETLVTKNDMMCFAEIRKYVVLAALDDKFILAKDNHGREFLATALVALDKECCRFICEMVPKSIVKFCVASKQTGDKYGHILYKAWMLAGKEDAIISPDNHVTPRQEFLQDQIQDLMHTTCHLSNETIFKEYRSMLSEIYRHRCEGKLNLAIYHMWRPIIFKGLRSKNSQVRYNTARLLDDVYPINDESLSAAEAAEIQDLQHAQLVALLLDEIPLIRIQAIQTVRMILVSVWDSMLPNTIVEWLRIWMGKLTMDASTPAVRVAAYKNLAQLISDQPLSHPLLTELVNLVQIGLFDVSDKVRLAFAEVLLACKRTPIPYTNASKIDMILACIETETKPEIQLKLASVVADTFFKPHEEPAKKVKRLSIVLKKNAHTTRTMFYYISKPKYQEEIYPNLENASKCLTDFLQTLANVILNNLRRAKEYFDKSMQKISLENSTALQNTSTASTNTQNISTSSTGSIVLFKPEENEVLISFLEISSLLITNILPRADREASKRIQMSYKDIVHSVLRLIEDPRAARTALYVARKLPPNAISWISGQAMSRLKKARDNDSKALLLPFIECIVEWRWIKQFSEMLVAWFSDSLKGSKKPKKPKNKDEEGAIRFDLPEDKPRPLLAIRYTDWILESDFISREIASTDIIYELRDALQPILALLKKRLGTDPKRPYKALPNLEKDDTLLEYLRVFLRLIIFGDLTLADSDWARNARRMSVTPKKQHTPVQSNASFDGCALMLKWIDQILIDVNHDKFNDSQKKIFKKCMHLVLEFMNNITAINQEQVPDDIIADTFRQVQIIWDKGLNTQYDRMAKLLYASKEPIKIDSLLKAFTKNELFKLEYAKPIVGSMLAKFMVPENHFPMIIGPILEDINVEIEKTADPKSAIFTSIETDKTKFLITKVLARLDKFTGLDEYLAKIKNDDTEYFIAALVWHIGKKNRWKQLFPKCEIDEAVYKRFSFPVVKDSDEELLEESESESQEEEAVTQADQAEVPKE